ncbi:MAG TPA: peptidoglycan editing factor PgeF [Syntrophaceae bacterium]|jgi:YfiH family protein|nr:peptidoglycan editing factor PgeF [Syntrophaceae bacterium]
MFRFTKNGPIEYLEATALNACDFLIHAFCTRRGGASNGNFLSLNFSLQEGDSIENVRRNWKILATAFNIAVDQFFVVNQVHGDRILVIDHPLREFISHQPLKFDAIITDQPGVAIGIKTADCVPIFFVDKVKQIVGVAHAGWKGTALNISAKVVDTFVKKFSCNVDDIMAAVGPAIGPCCYQVDELVYNAMESQENLEYIFCPCCQKGRWFLDLPLANTLQIAGKGIPRTNIYTTDYCTSCNTGIFYSHRAEEGKTGRQLNFIMLK